MSFDIKQVSPSLVRVDTSVLHEGKGGFSVTHNASYNIAGDGSITVDNAVIPQGPKFSPARIGVRMLLDKRLTNLEYLARGPMENYNDRKRGSDVGRYTSTVAGEMVTYTKPMENGNHEDTSWLTLRGAGVPTFLAKSEGSWLQFSTLPYTDEQMDPAEYLVDLPKSEATVLNLSAQTLGVGQAAHQPLPKYRIYTNPTTFSYGLNLLDAGVKDVSAIGRKLASTNRAQPVLAQRDMQGFISLDADSSYSLDGLTWTNYTKPFAFAKGGTLKVRSAAKGGQFIESSIPFDAWVNRSAWKATANNFEPGEGNPEHVLDGNPGTIWHSRYSPERLKPPHYIT
ncbi:hypothetical protein EON80_32325, partial [bacterium]